MTLLLLLSPLLLQQQSDWQYREGIGYVHMKTMENKSPEEFLQYGVDLAKQRQTGPALAVFNLILATSKDAPLKERSQFRKAETLYSGSRFLEAYKEFDDFLLRHPSSKLADSTPDRPGARELQMECAFLLIQVGVTDTFLGIPILKTPKPGIELLKATLQRYPREDCSDRYYLKLGNYYFDKDDYEAAETEYKFILEEYKETRSAPIALLQLGEIGLRRFDKIDYDIKGLKDARRSFERFIEEAPITAKISPEVKEIVDRELPRAREKVKFINETEAAKDLMIGDYYLRRGYPRSAVFYYKSILRNRRYVKTKAAAEAKKRLDEMGQ